ncbi:MAG: carbon starvation CstA family protein [Bacteroidales bacterium]
MFTFVICLLLLIVSYFVYGKLLVRIFGVDNTQSVPSTTHYDGIDFVPMPRWKTFLIQLLNIAGLGPIFGAILGATYGPVAFLWITLGGILIGGVHDFASGYMSLKMNGLSYPEILGACLGSRVKIVARVFIVLLMVLVGAVFMVGPAGILQGLTSWSAGMWIWIILAYYMIATVLPVNKVIGTIYPFFGFALFFMALGLMVSMFINMHPIPELSFVNLKTDAESFPIIPTLFITIACGAVSGFHATQSPMMARCVNSYNEARPVFFGAMIAESIIALIWAAIAMAFFGSVGGLNDALAAHDNNAAVIVELIANSELGRIGGLLALLGVVAAPISTGDTAFRSARLIIADFMKISQVKITHRLLISLPLFIIGFAITLMNFDVLWRYFAWINQTMAAATLWAAVMYLAKHCKNYHIALYPAIFMTFITSSYLFISTQFFGLNYILGMIIAGIVTLALSLYFIRQITHCTLK